MYNVTGKFQVITIVLDENPILFPRPRYPISQILGITTISMRLPVS